MSTTTRTIALFAALAAVTLSASPAAAQAAKKETKPAVKHETMAQLKAEAKITEAAAYCPALLSRRKVQPVIAEPNSIVSTQEPTSASVRVEESPLSSNELYQLTLYKWRYSLEAYGFQADEVRDLMFLKWLLASRRVVP